MWSDKTLALRNIEYKLHKSSLGKLLSPKHDEKYENIGEPCSSYTTREIGEVEGLQVYMQSKGGVFDTFLPPQSSIFVLKFSPPAFANNKQSISVFASQSWNNLEQLDQKMLENCQL